MKKLGINYLSLFLLLLVSTKAYQQSVNRKDNIKNLTGRYQTVDGLLFFIKSDSSFCILKGHHIAFDAAFGGCDTIAKGKWAFFSKSLLKLSDDINYKNVKFSIIEENRLSDDSVYFKVDLAKDNDFFNGRFKYEVTILGKIDFIESISSVIILPKKKVFYNSNSFYHLGLVIQDLYPLGCRLNGKCYQKIFFNVFEDQKLNTKANYFTIKLANFNDCFVERANVENEFVVMTKNKVQWRDIEFIKN